MGAFGMRTRLFFAALSVSVAITCASGPSYYVSDAPIHAPAVATDSLRDLVLTRVLHLGFKVYEAQDAVARLAELNVGVNATSDFLYADRESGCGLNCKKVEALLVSFASDGTGTHQRLTVTAVTCKRGWLSPWRLVHPSEAIRQAADTVSGAFRR
jgi:hypothetical protein